MIGDSAMKKLKPNCFHTECGLIYMQFTQNSSIFVSMDETSIGT